MSVLSLGETVKIICDFSNFSSRVATPKAKLQQKQIFYTLSKANKKMVVKSLASVTGQPIDAHTSHVYTELLLTIPSSASLTISNCSILQVDYIIEVGKTVWWPSCCYDASIKLSKAGVIYCRFLPFFRGSDLELLTGSLIKPQNDFFFCVSVGDPER